MIHQEWLNDSQKRKYNQLLIEVIGALCEFGEFVEANDIAIDARSMCTSIIDLQADEHIHLPQPDDLVIVLSGAYIGQWGVVQYPSDYECGNSAADNPLYRVILHSKNHTSALICADYLQVVIRQEYDDE